MATVQLVRRADWSTRLAAVANERRALPYCYGTNDCACFARVAIEAMTGTLLLPEIDPPKGMVAAARVLIRRGWEDVGDMMVELLGPAVDPAVSRIGDIVSYERGGELHLAVRFGDAALAPSLQGLIIIERADWLRAWAVG